MGGVCGDISTDYKSLKRIELSGLSQNVFAF